MALSTFLIVAQYAPSSNGGVDISLKTASHDAIPERVAGLSDSFLESVKESGAPVSEHLNIMLGLLYIAGFTMEGVGFTEFKEGEEVTGWMIKFHSAQ